MSGIVCKVWNIKGSSSVNKQLNDSIGYILNDEKTAMLLASSFGEISDPKDQLMRECKYIENDIKTFSGALVCSQNLVSTDVKDAVSEMLDVKDFYEKKDGRIALHGVISLPIDESDTKNASVLMKLCQDVLKEIFPNNQAIMAVHTNTENLHIHFIVNSVGIDGKKIHQDKSFVRNVLQKCVNRNALKYGFTPNDKWSIQRDQELSEFALLKIEMREAIDIAIEKSSSFDDFVNEMKSMDYIVNAGKHISIKRPNDKKAIRTHRLGNNYTKDAIIERIQTRKDKFKEIDMDSSVPTWHKPDDIFTPTLSHMKKYKDMSNDEKKTALHEIRLGKNPWRENFRNNWQLNNIANELNLDNRILEYKRFYSTDGTVQGTLKGIVNAKKSLSEEKKDIRRLIAQNRPIISIYNKMQELEKAAYLYEHKGQTIFKAEYDEYRSLTKRLEDGYNKTIFDVADFVSECDEKLTIISAQLSELSEEYREVKKYGLSKGQIIKKDKNLPETVGIYDDRPDEMSGVFVADSFYVASKSSDVIIKIVKTPVKNEKGRTVESYEATLLTKTGRTLEKFSNMDMGNKKFQEHLYNLGVEHSFGNDCERYKNLTQAMIYSNTDENDDSANLAQTDNEGEKKTNHIKKSYSFTHAINLKSVRSEDGSFFISNRNNPIYNCRILTNSDEIKITVYDNKFRIQESVSIPGIHDASSEGFEKLMKIQNKYGFSDEMYSFQRMDELRTHIESSAERERSNEGEGQIKKGRTSVL